MWEYKIHNFLTLCLWPRFLLREILTFTKVVGSVFSHVSHWKLPPLFIWLGQGFIKRRGQNPVAEQSIKRFELESRLHLCAWLLLKQVHLSSLAELLTSIVIQLGWSSYSSSYLNLSEGHQDCHHNFNRAGHRNHHPTSSSSLDFSSTSVMVNLLRSASFWPWRRRLT